MAAKWPHLLHLPSPNGRLVALIATVRAGPVWPTLRGIQLIFEELLTFTQQLNEEEQRAVRQGPSGEELAVFDLLTKPAPGLAVREESDVRKGVTTSSTR
jgi:type I restriction enzyme, R subunit